MLLLLALLQQIDSTVPVGRGQRLEVNAFAGEITVSVWNRDAVRVEADAAGSTGVEIDRNATTVSIRTSGRRGPPSSVDLRVTAPAWMALDLSGVNTEIAVAGTRAGISAETVQGDVTVKGGEGLVSLRSVQGGVSLTGARGRLEVNSVNADVEVSASSGEVTAETVNGDVTLDTVDATSVTATSLNGDVAYNGPVKSSGRYALSTHNGDVTLTVAEGTSASVSVSTFNGEFESAFPVTLTESRKGKRFNFTIGSGSAQVTLESFQGTIALVRPGDFQGARGDHDDDDE
ncbi:MAG TPA: DUF4097 family beta strand repeat-containing protein [Gemmatimonadales bacterium]|nr:DUF4097 family beta strand repeat-containing protein [Gemmatimonadales bacterium]